MPNRSLLLGGAEDIMKYIEKKLGVKEGEVTADGCSAARCRMSGCMWMRSGVADWS